MGNYHAQVATITSHRRWLSFSLRTLLIASVVVCAVAAWQGNAIRQRKAMLRVFHDRNIVHTVIAPTAKGAAPGASWACRMRLAMGEPWVEQVFLRKDCEDIRADVERAFPEAEIVDLPPSKQWLF